MFYAIGGKKWSAAVVTSDGIVVQATGNFEWACGQSIREVLGWAAQHDMGWSVSPVVPPGLDLRGATVVIRRKLPPNTALP